MASVRKKNTGAGIRFENTEIDWLENRLPFTFTTAQRKVIDINGEVLPIAECREDDGECQIVERYRNAPPDGMLCIGNKECGELFIPVSNILYIGVESEDED